MILAAILVSFGLAIPAQALTPALYGVDSNTNNFDKINTSTGAVTNQGTITRLYVGLARGNYALDSAGGVYKLTPGSSDTYKFDTGIATTYLESPGGLGWSSGNIYYALGVGSSSAHVYKIDVSAQTTVQLSTMSVTPTNLIACATFDGSHILASDTFGTFYVITPSTGSATTYTGRQSFTGLACYADNGGTEHYFGTYPASIGNNTITAVINSTGTVQSSVANPANVYIQQIVYE
jgi:hypothetical protein